MIQNTHLTAWQTYAPWPRRSQIEQDLLRPGLPKFDVDAAAVVVREAYFRHLKP